MRFFDKLRIGGNWKIRYSLLFTVLIVAFLIVATLTDSPRQTVGSKGESAPDGGASAARGDKAKPPSFLQDPLNVFNKIGQGKTPLPNAEKPEQIGSLPPPPEVLALIKDLAQAQSRFFEAEGRYGTFAQLVADGVLDARYEVEEIRLGDYRIRCVFYAPDRVSYDYSTYEIVATPGNSRFKQLRQGPAGNPQEEALNY